MTDDLALVSIQGKSKSESGCFDVFKIGGNAVIITPERDVIQISNV